MKTIKIKVPNTSYDTEMKVMDAVGKLLRKMGKELDVEIQTGQGGDLNDWKEPDLGNKRGRLMIFKVSVKGKEAVKEAEKYYKKAKKEYNYAVKRSGDPNGLPMLLAKLELDTAKSYLKQA